MKKSFLIILLATALQSCCEDCPVTESEVDCAVREATITEFNPELQEQQIGDSTFYMPVPEYSIHTFEFPADNASSGFLPNDSRFKYSEEIIIAREEFTDATSGNKYYAEILDLYPMNNDMVGDIMVVDVSLDSLDPFNSTADLRFYGYLAPFPEDFLSESASEFCDVFLEKYKDETTIQNFADASERYGVSLSNASSQNYTVTDISVRDKAGEIVTGYNPADIPAETVQTLLDNARANAVNLNVSPGEVYYYKARNGREFAVVIADIKSGSFDPNKKRVTIMFNAL